MNKTIVVFHGITPGKMDKLLEDFEIENPFILEKCQNTIKNLSYGIVKTNEFAIKCDLIDELDKKLILNGKISKKLKADPILAYNTAIENAIRLIRHQKSL